MGAFTYTAPEYLSNQQYANSFDAVYLTMSDINTQN